MSAWRSGPAASGKTGTDSMMSTDPLPGQGVEEHSRTLQPTRILSVEPVSIFVSAHILGIPQRPCNVSLEPVLGSTYG
jgi:hypothetical protein